MKLCYIVLLHHKFDQAARLVQRLTSPGVSFVIHIDTKAAFADTQSFRDSVSHIANITYAPRVDARWGSYRQALAILRSVQCAVRSHVDFNRCVLLSGQDYPVVGHPEIVEFFLKHAEDEFVEAGPMDLVDSSSPGWTPHYRFRRYHFWLGNQRMKIPVFRKRMPDIQFFHGATWWALTRAAVEHIVDRFEHDKALRQFMQTGFLVDEAYIPTLLMSSPHAPRVTGSNLTYARWDGIAGPHPHMLGIGDMATIRASKKLFARKFDASVDSALLDAFDSVKDSSIDHVDR